MEDWYGFSCETFVFEDYNAYVVFPKEGTAIGKVAVKTEYWDAFPEAIEIPLLEAGFHLCYITNKNRWGVQEDLERKARFVKFVQNKYHLSEKCVPIGMSCGGLIAIKFAAAYPDMISCLYLDAPVVNYMSCPCGFGVGKMLGADNSEILEALSLSSISELLAYRDMPLDHIPVLVKHRIPVVMVCGDSDTTVPYCENGIFIERAYQNANIDLKVYVKQGCEHHPHGLENPEPVLNFILNHI